MDTFTLLILFVSYVLFDVNYFIRLFFTTLSTFFRKKNTPFEETVVYGVCTTNDLDFVGHMNNTRYLREMDFARIDFWIRNGVYMAIRKSGSNLAHAGCSVRYRRAVQFLQCFRITTKLVYWEERYAYLEQRLETVHDGFVRAVVLAKQTIGGPGRNFEQGLEAVLGSKAPPSPLPPPDVASWIECNQRSSKSLRPDQVVQDEGTFASEEDCLR